MATPDSNTISQISEKESRLTGSENPTKGGPTAQAQKHANEPITSEVLHDITEGEKRITGGERVKGGPTSTAQSILTKSDQTGKNTSNPTTTTNTASGTSNVDTSTPHPNNPILDADKISKITAAENKMTGQQEPVQGGPTAQAQKHVGKQIDSGVLHDITEGEKQVSGTDGPVKGGPTATLQKEISKTRG